MFSINVIPVCAMIEPEQMLNSEFVSYEATTCTFDLVIFITCSHWSSFTSLAHFNPHDVQPQRHAVVAGFAWLDLETNRYILGPICIIFGLVFGLCNFQVQNKKQRLLSMNFLCIVCGGLLVATPLYWIVYTDDFSFGRGWMIMSLGFCAGQILFCVSLCFSLRVFILVIGIVTGFCFTNTLEIMFLYIYRDSHYAEYWVGLGASILLA